MERDQPLNPTRRAFLANALVGLTCKAGRRVAGRFVDDGLTQGHALRDGQPFPSPRRVHRPSLVIVGGGVAGLSAAWRLEKRGFRDFVVLEMASRAGGNAQWGENEITQFPWGAHYVPLPGRGAALVRELFSDLGVLRGEVWDDRALCFAPQERLFVHGRWQEGIRPTIALGAADRADFARFDDQMAAFRSTGQFTIPMAMGARPSPLDHLSMRDWLLAQGYRPPALHWYVNYACRDDYGALAAETSAWAGIHYFAARAPVDQGPLTWPAGNGWIVQQLLARLGDHVRTGTFVSRIARDGRRWRVQAGDAAYVADVVIFAAPSYLAPYLLQRAPRPEFVYSPWLVANLALDRWPDERGLPVAWDNVVYNSPALGYVVATHQSLIARPPATVWTYYWALANGDPAGNRRLLLERSWREWTDAILADLERPHPDIRACVSRIDILRAGHAMVRPTVGFLAARERWATAARPDRVFFANSDTSGLSLFEEANYRGVTAADAALAVLGGQHGEPAPPT